MELWLRILFGIAALGYLSAGVCAALTRERRGVALKIFALAGFFAHTCALAAIIIGYSRAPFSNPFELAESISWAIMALHIFASFALKMKIGEILVLFCNSALAGLPVLCPKFMQEISAGGASDFVGVLHALLAVASFAALAFSAALGGVYILSRRLIKNKSNSGFARENPPLAMSARLGRGALFFAAALMAASLLAGIFAASQTELPPRFALKFCAGSALFLMMLCLCFFSKKITELAAAKLCIALFIVSLLLLIPIEIGTRI
ncbi:MAG: hypothetical protein IKO42_03320 [Opitutales bacterium]|nr:hypothetical protein [Opitutales bacterium]